MSKCLKVAAVMDNFEQSIGFIEAQMNSAGVDDRAMTKVLTAAEEIIVNIIHYAYPGNPGDFVIEVDDQSDQIVLTFTDSGKPFDPLKKPDADTTLLAHEREIGGLGILMVKKLMDDVQYDYREGKNILTIMKKKQP
jgi:anti-sigma regulatory factor (Ser/Thr protein kinase)